MQSKLTSLALLAVMATTVHADTCQTTCTTTNTATCYVADKTRPEAPWAGTTIAYPQCYNTTNYVCDTVNYFLCPTETPVVCTAADYSRACFAPNTQCQVTNGNQLYNQQMPASDCTPTNVTSPSVNNSQYGAGNNTYTTAAPTIAPSTIATSQPTIFVPTGSFVPLPTVCDNKLPAIPSELPASPVGAYSLLFNITSATLNAPQLTCTTTAYTNFQAQLLKDLGQVLSISDAQQRLQIVSAQALTTNTLEVALNVLPSSLLTTGQASKFKSLRMRAMDAAADTLTPAGIVQKLHSANTDNTVYLSNADLKSAQVLCPETSTYTADCASVNSSPAVYQPQSGNNAQQATVTNNDNQDNKSYFQSHLYWIIPVIAVVGGVIVLAAIAYLIYSCVQRRNANQYAKAQAANAAIYDAAADDMSMQPIPVGARGSNVDVLQQVSSPSSHKAYVYVPAEFGHEQSRKRGDSTYYSKNNDTTSQLSADSGANNLYHHPSVDASNDVTATHV